MAYTPVPYLFGLLRKNLFDSSLSSNSNASVAHHAEPHHHHPQLKAKSAAPVNITAAPLRRQSEVSQFSSATSNDGLTDGGGLEGHVPHLICKFSSFFKILLTVQLASCPPCIVPLPPYPLVYPLLPTSGLLVAGHVSPTCFHMSDKP